jgi:hypothetical protein
MSARKAASKKTKPTKKKTTRTKAAKTGTTRKTKAATKSSKSRSTKAKTTTTPAADHAAPTPSDEILVRAERDINAVIESLNTQMNTALAAFTELASTHVERGKAVVRTAPLDRATATFQRLVAEVLDDQLGEMLPPLIALRNEAAQRAGAPGNGNLENQDDDFSQRSAEILDHVLELAGAQCYQPQVGETFDPLIHLAVGETHDAGLPDHSVAQALVPGFRSNRGKVLVPARVRVNRR